MSRLSGQIADRVALALSLDTENETDSAIATWVGAHAVRDLTDLLREAERLAAELHRRTGTVHAPDHWRDVQWRIDDLEDGLANTIPVDALAADVRTLVADIERMEAEIAAASARV